MRVSPVGWAFATLDETLAEAFYCGVPKDIAERAMAKLDDGLRKTVERFYETYGMVTTW